MNRRDTLLGILALGAAPFAVRAQPAPRAKPFRIGLLPGWDGETGSLYRKWVAGKMLEFGWVEGRDFIFVYTGLEYSTDQFEEDVRRVVAENPDLIIALTNGYAVRARKLTTTIPMVLWAGYDPVEEGLANSLARPGKNVTGITQYAGTGRLGKLVELLRDAKPSIKRIGLFIDWVPPWVSREIAEPYLQELRHAARAYGMTLHIAEVPHPDRVPAALAQIEAARPDAMIATSGPGINPLRQRVTQFAVDKRFPLIADYTWWPENPNPMLAYGPDMAEAMHSVVSYVDRILKGAKPGDLPFQQPSKFVLRVYLKTANAIGLTLPQLLLLRADEVVE